MYVLKEGKQETVKVGNISIRCFFEEVFDVGLEGRGGNSYLMMMFSYFAMGLLESCGVVLCCRCLMRMRAV